MFLIQERKLSVLYFFVYQNVPDGDFKTKAQTENIFSVLHPDYILLYYTGNWTDVDSYIYITAISVNKCSAVKEKQNIYVKTKRKREKRHLNID